MKNLMTHLHQILQGSYNVWKTRQKEHESEEVERRAAKCWLLYSWTHWSWGYSTRPVDDFTVFILAGSLRSWHCLSIDTQLVPGGKAQWPSDTGPWWGPFSRWNLHAGMRELTVTVAIWPLCVYHRTHVSHWRINQYNKKHRKENSCWGKTRYHLQWWTIGELLMVM